MGGAGENAVTEDKLPTIRDHTRNSENTKQQNSSMSVRVCRRSSAQDFLRDADFSGAIRPSVGDLAILSNDEGVPASSDRHSKGKATGNALKIGSTLRSSTK
jgi:hypothetical protein